MTGLLRGVRLIWCAIPLVLSAGTALGQCRAMDATPPQHPLSYPMLSDQYSVQYQVNGGGWVNGNVYISYYGKTNASPARGNSPYVRGTTSMSFVSIPADVSSQVQIQVTMRPTLSDRVGGGFRASDHVTARPSPKFVSVQTNRNGTVLLTTTTSATFNGEQLILWWNRGADGGAVEALAFYINPPYPEPPAGKNVLVVKSWQDLAGNNAASTDFDTLDFEPSATTPTAIALGGDGALAYEVPSNIANVYLGQDAWVQGKLRFQGIAGQTHVYGPGVLDGSKFDYLNRDCPTDDGLYSLSSLSDTGNLHDFWVEGIIISDQNHAANDPFHGSMINNVKTLGWNSNNAALRLDDSTTATNVFVRSSDDSLMIWGSPVSVSNATVWQGYNGGVVNLGWSNNSTGDGNTVDGLYVVKTDWLVPTAQSWYALSQPGPPNPLNAQNNGVFTSLMVPSTQYGTKSVPVFRNIFVEDPPLVLFSLKIAPSVNCPPGFCTADFLTKNTSTLNLKIENLFSPQSLVANSIGFQIIPANYIANGTDTQSYFPSDYTLTGTMDIEMRNVWIRQPWGMVLPLANGPAAGLLGNISTNGDGVGVNYSLGLP